jgi:hypothetical protein
MPFSGIADPEQLAVLIATLDDICLDAGIEEQSPERKDTANLIAHLYRNGYHTAEQLKAALNAGMQQFG